MKVNENEFDIVTNLWFGREFLFYCTFVLIVFTLSKINYVKPDASKTDRKL